jgi:uncharacterized protein (TIGR03083 family)
VTADVPQPDPTQRRAAELFDAMAAQWRRMADAVALVDDWNAPTRLAGWTCRTLLGHLVVVGEAIPRTLSEPPTDAPPTSVYTVFGGASGRAADNDRRAREFADSADPAELVARLGAAVAAVEDLAGTVDGDAVLPTRFGALPVRHFLVHRIMEGVVHGLDVPARVVPEPRALETCAAALTRLLALTRPELVTHVPDDEIAWVEAATGRTAAPAELRGVLPLLA